MAEVKTFSEDAVSGFVHLPATPCGDGIVLTHGAGANCQAALLVKVAEAFAVSGICVLRCDLPFRQRRRFGPPFPAQAAEDRNGLRSALAAMRKLTPGRIFLGGHSYGGRQASILVSEDTQIADALLLLSYPLHPPNKPEALRTAHFPNLRVPSLFIHGTKDPFGSAEEMRSAIHLIPAETELCFIERAGHDLAGGRFDIQSLVVEPFRKLVGNCFSG